MNAEDFVSRLQKVKRTAPGEWLACCPGHDDRTPSLAVKQGDDARILVRCYAGCSFEEVCGGAGVLPQDMFPERVKMKGEHLDALPFNPRTMLKAMAFNTQIIAILAADIGAGKPVSQEDKETAFKISEEFEEIVRVLNR